MCSGPPCPAHGGVSVDELSDWFDWFGWGRQPFSGITIPYRKLHKDALPLFNAYGTSAGYDLHALEDTIIPWGRGLDVRTGLAIDIPEGHYARITHRSSGLRKKGVWVMDGTIDTGYHGEIVFYVHNPKWTDVVIKAGESVAQLIIQEVPEILWEEVDEFPESIRGTAGFGSSGRVGEERIPA